ncbi:MAG: Rieske 2Fe-2S domain-containing protein [Thermoplasmata archaeon]|nr:Rieske 2Fe-2S domain-containing protein [Thermoplasmata archaeon]
MNAACPSSCPFVLPRPELSGTPGLVRRLAAGPAGGQDYDETKRNMLKLLVLAGIAGAAGGGLTGGSLQYAQPPIVGIANFPRVQLLDLDGSALTSAKIAGEYTVETNDVILFNYPLRNEPNFLLNLSPPKGGTGGASNVQGGVGPNKSIVAYSAICQHLGCPAPNISYYPPGTCPATPGGQSFYIHCTCHGSTYDVTNGASNLTGPAVLPLPQVVLEWNQSDDTIWATGMTPNSPPVNGHFSTLTGDYAVGSQSQLTKQQPIHQCDTF